MIFNIFVQIILVNDFLHFHHYSPLRGHEGGHTNVNSFKFKYTAIKNKWKTLYANL